MTALVIVLAAVVALLVARDGVKFAFKKDTAKEERRRAAAHLAATLKGLGLVDIPEFLTDYSVGDYSGMYEKIHDLAKLVLKGGEAAVLKEFATVFKRLLDAKLTTEEGRAYIASLLKDATPAPVPAPVVAPAPAPVEAVA